MVKNWKFLLTFFSLLVLIVGWFYWFQYRPSQIVSFCSSKAIEKGIDNLKADAKLNPNDSELRSLANSDRYLQEDYDHFYERCLKERGLD